MSPESIVDTTASGAVRARDVHKSYGSHHVIRGIDLDIAAGEVVTILGPSGGGKSTFLRMLNSLESPDSGVIEVSGQPFAHPSWLARTFGWGSRPLAHQRSRIGMVFQQFNLFPHLTALENVAAGPVYALQEERKAATERAAELLTAVGLSDKVGAYPDRLSGGQQQRVAIARALAMDPSVLLFDEPTSALDPEMVSEVLDVMVGLSGRGITMVVVTHEMGFARAAAHRVVFMADGRVVEQGRPDEFFTNPTEERSRRFLEKIL
ncbi:amino acid ABC transporter ATP-binding protein [Microbacterium betulae]|uniref:Amino acid ABC transporter ATP-binding protein n=1 Tax=Microbacterium betulae TaxID=2981139 RepID=A0AA97FID2_9MICO|nr:amino acid ABC transporter ATP-binding protein [Microbacterium sp. AB]WOF23253.1 amino acid ABC transporter ATP-binding protein [Microbacterium sp. AB]